LVLPRKRRQNAALQKIKAPGQLALAGAFLPLLISVLLKLAAEAEARKAIIRQRQPKAKN
jgi:hypothetical protein